MPQKPYKIVFFGTSDFAVPILERLNADDDLSVLEVVTQPDRPTGRKRVLTSTPVKRAAETFGLPVFQPEKPRGEEALAHFRALGADVFVVVSYGNILPKDLLDVPAYGGVNIHASLLPAYRGAFPIGAAIAAGEKETGVTVMKMDEKMDEGPTLATSVVPIAEDDTTATLSTKLARAAADLIGPTLKLYLEDGIAPVPQEHAKASYTKILDREDGRIDWEKGAVEIERHVRAMFPWPEAFTTWSRKDGPPLKLVIKKATVLHPVSKCDTAGRVGGICRLSDGTVGVNCGSGSLRLDRIQLEGKKETDAKSFLNGYPDFNGTTLR